MLPSAITAAALALYLIPFALALLVRGSRSPRSWELALDIPAVLAVDMLGVLAITFVVPLDWAVLVSRPAWLVVGALVGRKRRLAWPRCLGVRASSLVALGAAIGAWVSLWISRKWIIWDRSWHMPLVSSMEGQRIPFQNVYEPGSALHYHFAGDVHAGMLRALSFGHMSSGLALSLSHDVVFALTGAMLALLLVDRVRPATALVVFAVAVVMLHGPVVDKNSAGWDFHAHMYEVYLSYSFKPHVPLAGILVLGLVSPVCARATFGTPRSTELAALMLPCASLLGITDETSVAIALAALGAAWLLDGRLLGDRRWQGFALLCSMAVVAVATNLLLRSSFAPGGPVQRLEMVPARIVELNRPAHPLWDGVGLRYLMFDLLPLAVPTLGVVLAAVAKRSRGLLALAVLPCVATALSAALAAKIQINGQDGVEVERFFIGVFFVVLAVALWLLPEMPRWSMASSLVVFGCLVPTFYTVWWFRESAPSVLAGAESAHPDLGRDLYPIDCRRLTAAKLGERPELTYVDGGIWYFYTSCHAVFDAGYAEAPWPTRIRPAFLKPGHLAAFERMAPPGAATVPAVCASEDRLNDGVCRELRRSSGCSPINELFVRCELPKEERLRLLAAGL